MASKRKVLISFLSVAVCATFFGTGYAFAHGGDVSRIHACVKKDTLINNIFNSPNIRIVGANVNCAFNEIPLDWNIKGEKGDPGPVGPKGDKGDPGEDGKDGTVAELAFICTRCDLTFTDGNDTFRNGDYKDAILYNARLIDFSQGANFTNAKIAMGRLQAGTFNNVNFTAADLRLTNFGNATLNTVDFTNANLKESTGFDEASLTNITWSNTTCPDGTNSDNNGNTCEGHLIP